MSEIPAAAAVVEPVAAPPAPEPAPAPVAPVQSSEAPAVEAPVVSPAAVESTPSATGDASETPAAPASDPGLLAATPPAPPATDVPTVSGEPTGAEAEAAPVQEPVKYEPFTLPEGVTLAEDGLAKFMEVAGTNRLPQETAQQMLDLGIAEIQRVRDFERTEQHRVFSETRAQWRRDIMADEELGGSGFETNRAAAVRMLDLFVPEQHRDAFNQALIATGMTDHPAFFRLLVNIARKFDEPAPAPLPRNPPPDIGRNPGGPRRLNYDNPTSPRPNGAVS